MNWNPVLGRPIQDDDHAWQGAMTKLAFTLIGSRVFYAIKYSDNKAHVLTVEIFFEC